MRSSNSRMHQDDATNSNDRSNLDSSSAGSRCFREEKRVNRELDSALFGENRSRTLADLLAAENRRRRNAGSAAISTGAFLAPSFEVFVKIYLLKNSRKSDK